ncbi:(Fe-S)-binding protein [Alkaliphilus flagellatus]|uniref:(Fe-S)-binding protein n=1 Tax=Alkaliphilus flagellatus TaxID=2841507 RepID=UPI002ED62EEB
MINIKDGIFSEELIKKIEDFKKDCVGCSKCVRECKMLDSFCTDPKNLFNGLNDKQVIDPLVPYSCNQCGVCEEVCPKNLKLEELFKDIRVELVKANKGKSPIKGHRAVESHQSLSFSKVFTTTASDKNKETVRVFMPGCSLSSYSPKLVSKTLRYLQKKLPGTGVVLKCCGKPTRAIGQEDAFKERYGELEDEFKRLGVTEVITACQSCYTTIAKESPNIKIKSLWTVIPEIGIPEEKINIGANSDLVFGIHDSCATRRNGDIQKGARSIIKDLGYKIQEDDQSEKIIRCCGQGGMVGPANPELTKQIMKERANEVESDYVVTYCGACRESMVRGGKKSIHILDLMFKGPWNSKSDMPGVGKTPMNSWVNRYKSKKELNKSK